MRVHGSGLRIQGSGCRVEGSGCRVAWSSSNSRSDGSVMMGTHVSPRIPAARSITVCEEGRFKAARKRKFKLPWREAGSLNHHDDIVHSDQLVVNKILSLYKLEGLR